MVAHPPRAFPVGDEPPVGNPQVKGKPCRPARARRTRPRICLRKGCGRQYKPRAWNQRYCQEPECRREVRRWQAARRQAARRQDPQVRAQHAQAERARRQRAKAEPQAQQDPRLTSSRGHAADAFFLLPSATGQAATNALHLRPATRHITVAPPAGRPCATSSIVNANGSGEAPWMVRRSVPMSTRPPANSGAHGKLTPRPQRQRGHLPNECSPKRAGRQLSRGLGRAD